MHRYCAHRIAIELALAIVKDGKRRRWGRRKRRRRRRRRKNRRWRRRINAHQEDTAPHGMLLSMLAAPNTADCPVLFHHEGGFPCLTRRLSACLYVHDSHP